MLSSNSENSDLIRDLSPSFPTTSPFLSFDSKNYKYEEIGIEFKYPSSWFVNKSPRNKTVYIADEDISAEVERGLTHGWPGSFSILVYDDSQWHYDYYENKIKMGIAAVNITGEEYNRVEKVQIGTTDVYKVIQYAEGDMASVGGYSTQVWFINRGHLIQLEFPNEYNEYFDNAMYDEIFSTLVIF